jgi:hypothetical protein
MRNADELAKNQKLASCLAEKGGREAAKEIGAALGVAAISEIGGPEAGIPITVFYAFARSRKISKAINAVGNVGDVVECIDSAYGN